MKTRTLLDLLSLSGNLYMIARDEELMKHLKEWSVEAKKKANAVWDNLGEDTGEDAEMLEQLLTRVKKAKLEFDKKVEETAEKVYHRMKLAHENDIQRLEQKTDALQRELALTEARLIQLETAKKH